MATALLSACGDAGTGDDDDASDPPATRVTAETEDGVTVTFTDFTVECRASEDEQPEAQIVTAIAVADGAEQPRSGRLAPTLVIQAAETAAGTTVELPYDEVYGEEETFINAFVTKVGDEREISSSTEASSGEIEVVDASCGPEPLLEVRIDGVMESELSDGTVTVEGYVTAE